MTAGINVQKGHFSNAVELKNWPSIWVTFALYSLVIAILFAVLFKHKHDPEQLGEVGH
jgi:NHS family xanthosine MFS transporter